MQNDYVKLNNGLFLPCVGLNTENLNTQEKVDEFLSAALQIGYRYFDTAAVNKNISYIGNFFYKIFKSKKYKRDEIFIGYKLWNSDHFDVEKALLKFLNECKLTYVDYFYIHWPCSFVKENGFVVCENNVPVIQKFRPVKIWLEMERMVDLRLAKSIGICNFGPYNYNQIKIYGNFVPSLIQLECHPYLKQDQMFRICGQSGTVVIAYTPLSIDYNNAERLEDDQTMIMLAKKYNITVSQLVYSYLRMKNVCILVNCRDINELKENYKQLVLKGEDYDVLNSYDIFKRFFDPKNYGENIFK
ncbi:hypothetical protein BDAP_002731 [Binucleata daphniae]